MRARKAFISWLYRPLKPPKREPNEGGSRSRAMRRIVGLTGWEGAMDEGSEVRCGAQPNTTANAIGTNIRGPILTRSFLYESLSANCNRCPYPIKVSGVVPEHPLLVRHRHAFE